MNWYDVSVDDEMVVDCDGTVWVATDAGNWRYVVEDGNKLALSWDEHEYYPPEQYQPYIRLDAAARRAITSAVTW
ncbi:hypothetical protein SEA_TRAAWW1_140 [Mycobacterium phage Traaww1]|nr:hypothetical protein SEA_ASRIEL_140 [Mycobacterium phage Asriel]AVI03508.1 hypothetical protein SEA_BARBARIAN_142 [Mycobacterium phage Barbarian]QDH92003.1 hypothetical protein SEA_FLYPOTENUSE_138 [Mycobacterium phage Flypotenuse]QGJ91944.1 hypothetical protein SEA_TRAAWW1_140 [Mycobacterium phage Traaww1]